MKLIYIIGLCILLTSCSPIYGRTDLIGHNLEVEESLDYMNKSCIMTNGELINYSMNEFGVSSICEILGVKVFQNYDKRTGAYTSIEVN